MPRLLRIPKSGRSVIGGCRKTGSRTIEEQKAFLLGGIATTLPRSAPGDRQRVVGASPIR